MRRGSVNITYNRKYTLVRQKYDIFSWSVFWGIYNVVLLIMLHHGVSVQKPPGDKFSPLGKKFYSQFCIFSVAKIIFFSLIRESLFLSICAIIFMVYCRYCRNIAGYFSSFIYPVPIVIWSQIHGWGPNWSQICCVIKWPSQIKVNSVSHFFEQRHQIWSKCSLCCWWKSQYQLFHWNYSFWFYWLLTSNEWPLPPKLELVCPMDEHNFPPQIVPKCEYLNDASISTIEW